MKEQIRVLIIDDEPRLREAMETYLRESGLQVISARDAKEGLGKLYLHRPHLVVLDIMMPGIDGWETCRRIKELADVPIIMLTALGQERDKIRGLDLGADDYLVKPVSLRELEARIRAVLRRHSGGEQTEPGLLYSDGHLSIDSERWEVRCEGQVVRLTATERRLLFLLAANAGRILPSSLILEKIWGPAYVGDREFVKLYIWRLRRKIEPDPSKPTYIHTDHGIGYTFAPLS